MTLASSKSKTLQQKLKELRRQEEEKRTKDLAAKLNLPYLDLSFVPIPTETLSLLSEEKAKKAKAVIVHKKAKEIHLAVQNPDYPPAKEIIDELKKAGYQIKLILVSLPGLEKSWSAYEIVRPSAKEITGKVEILMDTLQKIQAGIKNLEDIKKQIEVLPTGQASNIVEVLLAGSLKTNASDIHLETKENKVNLRFRLDGILQDVVFLSLKTYQLVLNRIKLLAGLKLNIHDIAQDGRFTISVDLLPTFSEQKKLDAKRSSEKVGGKTDTEVRVSVLPSAYGENIALRVLNPKMIGLDLKDLGFPEELLKIVEKEIKKPNGLIITTGPTGSGKTTALYAFLKAVNKPEIKIITLEDPIEYHLEGITQTQVETEKGYTFTNGLRAILRQDPDVILVGEIRDKDTAEIALQASLTGHLVFSTLHTNDAAGAVSRFIELGAKAPILASGLNLVIAQRLVRKLCLKCRQTAKLSAEQIQQIKKGLNGLKIEIKKLYQPKGCQECNQSGYQGRIGIFEMISVDDEMEKLISSSPFHAQVLTFMQKKGTLTMKQDALLKVIGGITSLEEVERVISE